ncbi:MAG: alpha-glucan family phosphorylase [Syntrophales bacterium]
MQTIPKWFPNMPERIIGLEALAANLWWSWHPAARMLFKNLDRPAWKESGHNPVKMLKELPGEILQSAASDPEYLRQYDAVMNQFRNEIHEKDNYFSKYLAEGSYPVIAYFSAEYGLHHSLPFYAGGLGFLAGDFLKECSDLCIPVVGVGFMYPEGYVRQRIGEDGRQESLDEILDRDASSISRVLNKEGEQLIVRVPFMDPPIYVAVWKVDVGRIPLYLMDTDIQMNNPWNRMISTRLYIGDLEQRIRQEIVLGIGGCEVLETLGINHEIIHLNEGHPAFALLERIRYRVQKGIAYEKAMEQVKSTSVFTTHTPLSAATDVFPFPLMEKYFQEYWPALGLTHDSFLRLGIHPRNPQGFNMTVLALRLSNYRNGVSRKHTGVSQKIWKDLWPGIAENEVPIDSITNGIHVPTWIEPKLELLFNKYLGPDWLQYHDTPEVWDGIEGIPDGELWNVHYWLKVKLVNVIREAVRLRWVRDKVSPSAVLTGGTLLDPAVLTVGFARRFTGYKRADLILYDPERLKKLVSSRWRPVQIIFAGKAHPADDEGKMILQRVYNAARNPELGGHVAFVEDYGEQFAQYMVHGVDVWLNNPLPPLEASGTSGMKAALNGVPHLSIMDGWWVEGFNGKNGWAFNHREIKQNRDEADAESLYDLLEKEIIPLYYRISDDGIPHGWVKVMKESIKSNAARFSSRRMVKDYVLKFYIPAAKSAQ